MLVTPNNAKIPGVPIKYKLIGSDQRNAINIKKFLDVKVAKMAKHEGRNNIKKVVTAESGSEVE
jgi:hypothetical protein